MKEQHLALVWMMELKQGDATIHLGSGHSHLQTIKANELVILGTCSEISLGQNCWIALPQSHREESCLIGIVTSVNFNALGTLNSNSTQINDLCGF